MKYNANDWLRLLVCALLSRPIKCVISTVSIGSVQFKLFSFIPTIRVFSALANI